MIVGQKVGYARVSTNAQDLTIQREKLTDCDRISRKKFPGVVVPHGPPCRRHWPTSVMVMSLLSPSWTDLLARFTTDANNANASGQKL